MPETNKIAVIVTLGVPALVVLYWLSYFIRCCERKDMTRGNKLLWIPTWLIALAG